MKRKHLHYGVAISADQIAKEGMATAVITALCNAAREIAFEFEHPTAKPKDEIAAASLHHVIAGAKCSGMRLSLNLYVDGE